MLYEWLLAKSNEWKREAIKKQNIPNRINWNEFQSWMANIHIKNYKCHCKIVTTTKQNQTEQNENGTNNIAEIMS